MGIAHKSFGTRRHVQCSIFCFEERDQSFRRLISSENEVITHNFILESRTEKYGALKECVQLECTRSLFLTQFQEPFTQRVQGHVKNPRVYSLHVTHHVLCHSWFVGDYWSTPISCCRLSNAPTFCNWQISEIRGVFCQQCLRSVQHLPHERYTMQP